MPMKRGLAANLVYLAGLIVAVSGFSQTPTPVPSEGPTSISPDKKWEFFGGDDAKLVKAETNETVVNFVCNSWVSLWAPDSMRFATTCPGKDSSTLVYQLRNGKWETSDDDLGNGDEIMDQAVKAIKTKAKKKRLPKKAFLQMHHWTIKPEKWIDARTLVVYAEMWEVARTDGPDDADTTFTTDLLLTLKFDDSGGWKIIKTHEMSEKEVKQRESRDQ